MSSDAYAPPEARLTDARSAPEKVYSLNQMAVATFLGSPLAGCWLMRKNYGVFRDERGGRQALLWGVLSSLAIIGLSIVLPDKVPNSGLPVLYTLAFRYIASGLQGPRLEDEQAAGPRKHSWWRVIGISVVCAFLFVAAATPIVLLIKGVPPPE